MPIAADQSRLWGHVASLPCGCCGQHGVQVAHSNQSRDGKGMSLKSYPWRVAALCPRCHVEIDSGSALSRAERLDRWEAAHRQTIGALFERGLLRPV